VAFDLQAAVDVLTDQKVSVYVRAIKLFELQAYIFCPSVIGRPRTARLFAAMKMLELIESEIQRKEGRISIRSLAANDDYAEIYDTILMPSGGFARIRHLLKSKKFDEDLLSARRESRVVSKCVDFSYRYKPTAARGHVRPGVTMAIYVVPRAQSFNVRRHRTVLKERWAKYRLTACFLFLIHELGFKFKPRPVSKNRFAAKLIEAASAIEELEKFFLAYSAVSLHLKEKGYSCSTIKIRGEVDITRLSRPSLDAEARRIAENYIDIKAAAP
jgi:hypothetical protein